MDAVLFISHLLIIAVQQIHAITIALRGTQRMFSVEYMFREANKS